jgi:hypothetical protein
MSEHPTKDTVFRTPWFELVARKEGAASDASDPYYYLVLPDYVAVVATTVSGDFVLVRQFRPALDRLTLEVPSGQVDPGETPEQGARRELMEETGYLAGTLIKQHADARHGRQTACGATTRRTCRADRLPAKSRASRRSCIAGGDA